MIVGVTGSREPRTDKLVIKLMAFFAKHNIEELHHGDCTGWDHQAFLVAESLGIKTVSHPPDNPRMTACTNSTVILPAKPYLDRNKDIVNAVDFLIAAPSCPERQRSGTWSTVRYAKKVGVRGVVWCDNLSYIPPHKHAVG